MPPAHAGQSPPPQSTSVSTPLRTPSSHADGFDGLPPAPGSAPPAPGCVPPVPAGVPPASGKAPPLAGAPPEPDLPPCPLPPLPPLAGSTQEELRQAFPPVQSADDRHCTQSCAPVSQMTRSSGACTQSTLFRQFTGASQLPFRHRSPPEQSVSLRQDTQRALAGSHSLPKGVHTRSESHVVGGAPPLEPASGSPPSGPCPFEGPFRALPESPPSHAASNAPPTKEATNKCRTNARTDQPLITDHDPTACR